MPNMETLIKKTNELRTWEQAISNMSGFLMNDKYTYTRPNNKYYRFIDHVKGWIQEAFNEDDMGTDRDWRMVAQSTEGLYDNWWEVALKGGKSERTPLPKIPEGETAEQAKEHVYNHFLPAYRALKESFDKRSVFQFIFNHRQYTAERDALKALTSFITNLTGDTKAQLQEKYAAYKVEVPTSNIMAAREQEILKEAQIQDEIKEQEQEKLDAYQREQEVKLQEAIDAEKMEIENKKYEDLTMKDQTRILCDDNTFVETTINELKEVLSASKLADNLIKLMIKPNCYQKLQTYAEQFSIEFDNLKEGESEKAELEACAKKHSIKMFKEAFKITAFFKIDNLKDRIIAAQKMADIMLNSITPVSFQQNEYAQYGRGYAVLQQADAIRDVANNYSANEWEEALTQAQAECKTLYPDKKEREQILVNLDERQPQEISQFVGGDAKVATSKIEK